MHIYNTLTREIEEVVPLEPGKLKMYSCGPTVYRYIHIGNLRTFTMADWIRRLYEYRGFEVLHVKNITDVGHMRQEVLDQGEDKIISQAKKEGKTSAEIAQFYTKAFHADEEQLKILPAHVFPRATQHIPEMIKIIEGLLEKDIAYAVNGYVYYDVKRFSEYGKLSGNLLENMQEGVHEGIEGDRRHPEDFPLWKPAEPGREMAWESPWGRGFPGWHIECSAMSMKYLGEQFDMHTGGVDNIFPHHEDEIAQSEGFSGHQFVNYWVHAQHLLADGQKMAKATGNVYTREEIEARGFDPLSLRYFYTTALYRSRLNFTFRALRASQISLERLRANAYRLLQASDEKEVFTTESLPTNSWLEEFLHEVEYDLNMPRAMSVVWAMLRSQETAPAIRVRTLLEMDRILGFDLKNYLQSEQPRQRTDPDFYLAAVPARVAEQVQERSGLRQSQAYNEADTLRGQLEKAGYELRDTPRGSLIEPLYLDEEFPVLSHSTDGPDNTDQPDRYAFSINIIAHNSRSDLQRALASICRYAGQQPLEVVIIENGSTDDTLNYLRELARQGELEGAEGQKIALQVLFADHNMGFAAGRNATMRASLGRNVVLLDTSIEFKGEVWSELNRRLADPEVGLVGPFGLVTDDLRDFREAEGPQVDAIEGYLMAFPRRLLQEVGWLNERFRFYRLADIYFSFYFKAAGYLVLTTPEILPALEKHPHLEWYSLSEEERRGKSKKNYDIFRDRWHHGESLLAANYDPQKRWFGHDHAQHLEGTHTHDQADLPSEGIAHTHDHRHWADHSHEHPHYHSHQS